MQPHQILLRLFKDRSITSIVLIYHFGLLLVLILNLDPYHAVVPLIDERIPATEKRLQRILCLRDGLDRGLHASDKVGRLHLSWRRTNFQNIFCAILQGQ